MSAPTPLLGEQQASPAAPSTGQVAASPTVASPPRRCHMCCTLCRRDINLDCSYPVVDALTLDHLRVTASPLGALAVKPQPQRSPPPTWRLAGMLDALSAADEDYWAFEDRDRRPLLHSLFQYPAMMVPGLHRELLETFTQWDPTVRVVYDPFVGAGTIVTEAMLLGLDFFGCDINPLAVLICRVKAGTFDADRLEGELDVVLRSVEERCNAPHAEATPDLRKWFEPHVAAGLGELRAAIAARPCPDARRFWWVAFAETIRLTSNSRTSTVKLHLRPRGEIANRPNPVDVFRRVASRNVDRLREQRQCLAERGLLAGTTYRGNVTLRVGDVADMDWASPADLMVSSPPYGDNHTTIPYGQAAYLPLRWIDRRDIGHLNDDCVKNTHRTDTLSLGGSRSPRCVDTLLDRSPHLRAVHDALARLPADRRRRVESFYADLDDRLDGIVASVRPGGVISWTTGDRTVGGVTIEMAPIVAELLGQRVEFVAALRRRIPSSRKRMPRRNSVSATIRAETILVVRRREEPRRSNGFDDGTADRLSERERNGVADESP